MRDIHSEAKVLNDDSRTMVIRTHEPAEVLQALSDRTDVLLEGGPTLAGAFLRAGAIDRILAYVAPILLGGPDRRGRRPSECRVSRGRCGWRYGRRRTGWVRTWC